MKITGLILILAGILIFSHCSKNGANGETIEKKPISVKVQKVKKGSFVRYSNYKGTVHPWKRANITPDTSGKISKIYKKAGDLVQAGELLAELDTTTQQLQQNQAQAGLDVAKAAYKDAQLNFQRIESLHKKQAVSQMQFEKTQLALESADTQLKNAKANLDMVTHMLNNSYMKSPFSGVVTAKNMEEGDNINPMMGMNSFVLTVMDLSRVKIIIHASSEEINTIYQDQPCLITVDYLDEEFSGLVYSKNLAADPVSKTFQVEVIVNNSDLKIKPGVFAEVRLEIHRQEDVLMIPQKALLDGNRVVIAKDGLAKFIYVTSAAGNDTEIIITSGLNETDHIIVDGNYDLAENSLIVFDQE